MAVWKNRFAADPTLENDQEEDQPKRPKKVEKKARPTPLQHARCWACWTRIPIGEKDDPDDTIEAHRKSTCPKGYTSG